VSDSPGEFRRKREAMFNKARAQLNEIGRLYVLHLAADLIIETWGPNKQAPNTEYEAKGYLRAGWSWDTAAHPVASRWNEGATDESGAATLAAIEAQVRAHPIARISFLWNDVAYGYLVANGLGRHLVHGPRNWVLDVSKKAGHFAVLARHEAMGTTQ
jgi:hypothetical protein